MKIYLNFDKMHSVQNLQNLFITKQFDLLQNLQNSQQKFSKQLDIVLTFINQLQFIKILNR